MNHSIKRPGFTLLEVMVVVAIIVILLAMVFVAIQKLRESASKLACANNLKQIGLALQVHHQTYGFFPSNGGWDGKQTIQGADGKPTLVYTQDVGVPNPFIWGIGDPKLAGKYQTGSWAFAILPNLEESNTYQRRDWANPVSVYICPSRRRPEATEAVNDQYGTYSGGGWKWTKTDYAGNAWVIRDRPGVMELSDIRDGASNTVLVGEKAMSPVNYSTGTWYWDEPFFTGGSGGTKRGFGFQPREGTTIVRDSTDIDLEFRYNWGSAHAAGAQFLFADGSVRTVAFEISPDVVLAILTPNGREPVPEL